VFFDFGVFAAVAGATLLALTSLGRLERAGTVRPASDGGGR
jgi:hypothetical protein